MIKKKCETCKGTNTTNSVGRLYGHIIKASVEQEQSSFRLGKSYTDNISCLKQLIEKYCGIGFRKHI